MTEVCLPKMGKIVIIDDETSEGFPLVNALSREGISSNFFTGTGKYGAPESLLKDVRLIFLDVYLKENITGDANILSTLDSVFNKIVDKSQLGPYFLIGWTHQADLFNRYVENYLRGSPPVLYTCLTKEEFQIFDEAGNVTGYDIDAIKNKINSEFEKLGVFKHLLLWENIIYDSTDEILKIFEKFEGDPLDHWNRTVPKIFYNLAKENLGQSFLDDHDAYEKNIVIQSLMVFNHAFLDCIESKIHHLTEFPRIELKFSKEKLDEFLLSCDLTKGSLEQFPYTRYFEINDSWYIPKTTYLSDIDSGDFSSSQKKKLKEIFKLDETINAKINSKLHLVTSSPTSEITPGFVFELKETDNIIKTYDELFTKEAKRNNNDQIGQMKKICIEISPQCDYAQKKWQCHRILPGILCPENAFKLINGKGKNSDFIYATPPLWINDGIYRLIFNIHNFQAVHFTFFKEPTTKITQIRNDLLFDLQKKVGQHIQRFGMVTLEMD